MGHTYLLTFPVSDKQEARNLGASSAWEVIEELREAGLNGLTAEEISVRLGLPLSTVYGVLSKLQSAKWVEPRRPSRKIGRPTTKRQAELSRTGRMKQIYVEKIPWGDVDFEEKFIAILDPVIKAVLERHDTVEHMRDTFDAVLTDLSKSERAKEFLPSIEICPKCKESHEAYEFLWALCIRLNSMLLEDFSDKLRPMLEKHKLKTLIQSNSLLGS